MDSTPVNQAGRYSTAIGSWIVCFVRTRTFRRIQLRSRDLLRDSPAGQSFARHIGIAFPVYVMWDDHDYGANNAGKGAPWRRTALRAFHEYHALPELPNRQGLWHQFRYGQAEFFMLDLRSQRDHHRDPDDADKSMLDGDEIAHGQKDWLFQGLLASTARWKFIVSSVPFNPTVEKWDTWTTFQTERREILDFIQENDISGVVILSGDLHTGGAIDDGSNAGLPEVSTPHMNLGHAPPTGCTGGHYCGDWSDGFTGGDGTSGGFAVVEVRNSMESGDSVLLHTRTLGGENQKTLRLNLE